MDKCGTELTARRAVEKLIRLAGPAGEGWWALNAVSVRTPEGNTDVDVLVGVPGVGLLIIEVKGWRQFSVDHEGKWSYRGERNTTVNAGDGPFKQAERQEYLLLKMLVSLRDRRNLSTGELPKIGSCVLFGNLMSKAPNLPPLDKPRTLFRDTLCHDNLDETTAKNTLAHLRTVLNNQFNPTRPMNNGVERLAEIGNTLSPLCSVKGMSVFADDSQIQLDSIAEAALGEKASMFEGTRLYVEGAAGTGKTVYALKLALERSRGSGRPALYTCFSRRLAEEVRATPWLDDDLVVVGTPEELLERFGGGARLEHFLAEEQKSIDADRRVAEMMGTENPGAPPRAYLESSAFAEALVDVVAESHIEFSAVVVDEAQDLADELLDGLSSLVSSSDLFAVFADPRQTTRRERASKPWHRPASLEEGTSLVFSCNYRNGDRIIDAVESEFSIGYARPPRGASPAEVRVEEYVSASDMPTLVAHLVDELRDEGLEPEVLVSAVQPRERDELHASGISTTEVDEFKGLERQCIVLIQGPHPNPLDPNREDSYVGMTRATTVLTLVRRRK